MVSPTTAPPATEPFSLASSWLAKTNPIADATVYVTRAIMNGFGGEATSEWCRVVAAGATPIWAIGADRPLRGTRRAVAAEAHQPAHRRGRWQASSMVEQPDEPTSGRIVIEWVIGHDPDDFDTYGWRVTCEPKVADDLVVGVLGEVLKVY